MKFYKQEPMPSPKHLFAENVAYMFVVVFLVYIIDKLFDALTFPFRRGEGDLVDKFTGKVDAVYMQKVQRRSIRQEKFDEDTTDPMHQFQERFLIHPEQYRNDPDNAVYFAWHKEWKNGNIRDTWLRWAPSVESDTGGVNPNFLNYLSIQACLHQAAPLLTRRAFLWNISQCYPEFTPSYKGLEEDIYHYRSEVICHQLEDGLVEQLNEAGLGGSFKPYIKGLPVNQIPDAVKFFGKCFNEYGYGPAVAYTLYRYCIEPGSEKASMVRRMIDDLEMGVIAEDYISGKLDLDDLKKIADKMNEYLNVLGETLWTIPDKDSGLTYFEQLVRNTANDVIASKNLEKVNVLCALKK